MAASFEEEIRALLDDESVERLVKKYRAKSPDEILELAKKMAELDQTEPKNKRDRGQSR